MNKSKKLTNSKLKAKLYIDQISLVRSVHDIYTVNGITIRTLRLDFARNYNVLSFRHKVSQQYLVVCWLWRLGPCLNSTLWVRSSPGAFSNFFVGGSKVDPKLHPIHKGTCGDTIHSINTMFSIFHLLISPNPFKYLKPSRNKVWVEKTIHMQKLAISKNSTMFVLSSWNLVKMIISWVNNFHQVPWG